MVEFPWVLVCPCRRTVDIPMRLSRCLPVCCCVPRCFRLPRRSHNPNRFLEYKTLSLYLWSVCVLGAKVLLTLSSWHAAQFLTTVLVCFLMLQCCLRALYTLISPASRSGWCCQIISLDRCSLGTNVTVVSSVNLKVTKPSDSLRYNLFLGYNWGEFFVFFFCRPFFEVPLW